MTNRIYHPKAFSILAALSFLSIGIATAFAAGGPAPDTPTLLKSEISAQKASGRILLMGCPLPYRKDIDAYYRVRKYRPAWTSHGHPIQGAWELLDAVRSADQEGLEPDEYAVKAIDGLLRQGKRRLFWGTHWEPKTLADLDLYLTGTYLAYADHLLSGRIRPKALEDGWHFSHEPIVLTAYLDKALAAGDDIGESLRNLAPSQPEYGKMKYWLGVYRKIEAHGGWNPIPSGPALGPESRGPRVTALCRRLQAEGYAREGDCPEAFTSLIGEALKRFQITHGLAPDGVADVSTLRQLNVSIQDRIDQIKLNLDCWRWLPQNLGDRHIRVNIADFRLGAFEGGREAFSMRVVVGRKADSTPVFSDRATAISLNPSWNVPASIAREEMLPELKKDPAFLEKHDMELLADWTPAETVLKADSIDWSKVDTADFKFRVRQKNGEASALGRLKVVLTNPFNIYLHDTPSKQYFERDKRALSHGCVRLEDPLRLAEWLLGPEWPRARLQAAIDKGETQMLPVPGHGVPVHILYWTAFIDPEGGLQFRSDIYAWEKRLQAGLVSKASTR